MQINITGFLQAKNSRIFMGELWELLVSAQENIGGIPSQFLEKKKEEIKQRKVKYFNWVKEQNY
jgi:serine/arginine repetitive matrix protein 1